MIGLKSDKVIKGRSAWSDFSLPSSTLHWFEAPMADGDMPLPASLAG